MLNNEEIKYFILVYLLKILHLFTCYQPNKDNLVYLFSFSISKLKKLP